MRHPEYSAQRLRSFLKEKRIASLYQMKDALGTRSTMTVFRKLKSLGYLTSYSHRGGFYTLTGIPRFNAMGLWSYQTVHFSQYGNLQETARAFVGESDAGYTADELACLLHVDAKHALLVLSRERHLKREKAGGRLVYFDRRRDTHTRQKSNREASLLAGSLAPIPVAADSPEFHAGLMAFFDLLDERQKRLFAGLQAAQMGHGGDRCFASLLGMDIHTVAKGRREALSGLPFERRLRKKGAGRKRIEKKTKKS
jgi:hypothetical protein